MLDKIVSGGQTGADRAALDFARASGLRVGGWVPQGRLAEDGRIPEHYLGMVEADSTDPAVRTALNVRDSDATLILSHGPLAAGSLLTFQEATRVEKPVLHLDLDQLSTASAAEQLRGWLATIRPRILNVAGPRASEDPGISSATEMVLGAALRSSEQSS